VGKSGQNLETERHKLQEEPAQRGGQDADLIDALPILTGRLDTAPEDLRRARFDAYGLRVRYKRVRDAATITVTVTGQALATLQDSAQAVADAKRCCPCSVCPRRDSNPHCSAFKAPASAVGLRGRPGALVTGTHPG
jgi:hypothetical protein